MKSIFEYILLTLSISLALTANVIACMLIYDSIKERIKNRGHD